MGTTLRVDFRIFCQQNGKTRQNAINATTCHNNIVVPKKIFLRTCLQDGIDDMFPIFFQVSNCSILFWDCYIAILFVLLPRPAVWLGTAPFPSSSPWNSPGACHFSVTYLVGQHVLFLGFNPNVKWINAIVCRFTLHVWLVDTKNNHPPPEIYNFGLRCGSHQRNRTSAQAVRRSVAGTGAWHMSLRENVLPNNLIGIKVDHIFFHMFPNYLSATSWGILHLKCGTTMNNLYWY